MGKFLKIYSTLKTFFLYSILCHRSLHLSLSSNKWNIFSQTHLSGRINKKTNKQTIKKEEKHGSVLHSYKKNPDVCSQSAKSQDRRQQTMWQN